MRLLPALVIACSAGSLAGCASRGHAAPDASADAAPVVARSNPEVEAGPPDAGAALMPLRGEWLEKMEENAFVAPPLGATEKRPVIVALHGAFDHPGYMCSAWRVIADAYAFVVCPAGRPARPADQAAKNAFVWSSSDHIARAIDAALAAARTRYGEWMLGEPYVYVAFSQAATLAGPVLAKGRFPRAALTEGGYHAFEDGFARAFVKSGGERVLYTCSQGGASARSAGPRRR